MSSTIYYKGTLKDDSTTEELYAAVLRQSSGMNCKIVKEEDSFYIEFLQGMSEPLLFKLSSRKINWFCKWSNPENPDEYYKIFDLFIAIKPFFKSLRIDDDEGAWQNYLLKSKPCKIVMRELSGPAETSLLERDFNVSNYDLSGFMKPGMRFVPYSDAVYCVIAQDFMRVFRAETIDNLDKDRMLDLANRLLAEEDEPLTHENFAFSFPYILLLIWIGHCLTYGNKGRVHRLTGEVRGLKTSRAAAEFGLLSVFLNIHSGTANAKHAEMKRFAADYIYTGPKNDEFSANAKAALSKIIKDYVVRNGIDTASKQPVIIPVTGEFKDAYEAIFAGEDKAASSSKPENIRQSLDVLVSMLDYLGFRYVGPEEVQ